MAVKNSFRETAIAEYHRLLKADPGLSTAVFEKLRNAMRHNRLVYGDRPIGISLRPHLMESKQFELLVNRAQLVASALEKIVNAAVKSPSLMRQLGMN